MIDTGTLAVLPPGTGMTSRPLPDLLRAQLGDQPEGHKTDRLERGPGFVEGGFQTFGFRFRHLAIRREIQAFRSYNRPEEPPTEQSKDPASSSGVSIEEQRQTELNLFIAQSRSFSLNLDPATADRFESTSRNVGRTFEVNITLDASFLTQYSSQSRTLSEGDPSLFDRYLSTTDEMTQISGEATQGFFDLVDEAIKNAISDVASALDAFLNKAGKSFGLEGDALQNFKSQVADQVAGFFAGLNRFVSRSQELLTVPPRQRAESPPPIQGPSPA